MEHNGKGKGHQDQISLFKRLQIFHKEVETSCSKKYEQRVRSSLLGKADVIRHKGKGEGARQSDRWREGSRKKIKERYREGSEN